MGQNSIYGTRGQGPEIHDARDSYTSSYPDLYLIFPNLRTKIPEKLVISSGFRQIL